MKMYGKSEDCIKKILDSFEQGTFPKALAQVYIHRNDNVPCNSWSANNQFLTALNGTSDARGFNQWKTAGRMVKKGEHAVYILIPLIGRKKNEKTGEDDSFLYGFKSAPVFKIESTEVFDAELWEKANKVDETAENWIKSLPLYEVAQSW